LDFSTSISYIYGMDILTDILNSAGLAKPRLLRLSFHAPYAQTFPCAKSIGFHLVTQGEGYVRWASGHEPLLLKRGDIVMIKRGLGHEVATDLKVAAGGSTPADNGGKPLVSLVTGVYQFQTPPIHPLFSELPDLLLFRSEDIAPHSPLAIAQQLLSAEIAQDGPGSDTISKSLVDVMFHYILREWLEQKKGEGYSWSRAIKDGHLQKAIAAIHAEPAKDWSVEQLAQTAGISRAAFAQKFRRLSGDTPAHYLTRVRVQRAMDLLRSGDDSVERIAEAVGYNDSFVFSKAFKRIQGVSPKEFRKQLA
jgi:AraC-like DNA-binding protein